jgi:hypothetical protein
MAYKILVSEPTTITPGMALVVAARKSTVKNPVPETEKYRAVEVKPYLLPVAMEQKETAEGSQLVNAQDVFNEAIREAFGNAASEILKEYCIANKAATEISEDALSFGSVIAKMADMQTSERLNGEQIKAWYDASKTKTDATTRYTDSDKGKKQQAQLRDKYIALASNNSGIDATLATKMLGYLNADDTANPVCAAVARRLERLSKVDTADDL